MNTDAQTEPSIELAAALLAAYLARPDLPDRVEMCCLQAAAELQRAATSGPGRQSTELDGQIELEQVLDTLHGLPEAVFDSDPVLNAVWHLNAAFDALTAAV